MAKRRAKGEAGGVPADEAFDEVYLGDLEGFVGRRNELAKRLRAGGDAGAAETVRALKKPSRAAWAINVYGDRDERGELLEAGAALREAHERLMAGDAERSAVRTAAENEQAAVASALGAVAAVAEEAGAPLSAAALERARETLHAVSLDEAVRADFERRRLHKEHEATGLGGLGAGSAPGGGDGGARRAKDRDRETARRQREAVKAAEKDAAAAQQREGAARREVDDARERAEAAQRDLMRATKALQAAEREAEKAGRRLDDLRDPSG